MGDEQKPASTEKKRPVSPRSGAPVPVGTGRPKGVPNKATRAIRQIAQDLTFGNPKVIETYRKQLEKGTIHPLIFRTLLEYAYGKVKFEVEVTTPDSPVRSVAVAMARAFSRAEIAAQYELDKKLRAAQDAVDAETVEVKALAAPRRARAKGQSEESPAEA